MFIRLRYLMVPIQGLFPQDVNAFIAKQLGLTIVDIPGGHLGYIQKPAGFAKVLLSIWG